MERVLPWLVIGLLAAGCGDDSAPSSLDAGPDDADAGVDAGDLLAPLGVEVVAELPILRSAAIAALDERRIALVEVTRTGDAHCPDCVELDPEQCPELCERDTIDVKIIDVESGAIGAGLEVREVFPPSFDHSVGRVDVVHLGGERVGIGWLECDNQSCSALAASQSCSALYTTVDLASGEVGEVATLYEDRFADLTLAANPALGQVLAVTGKGYGAWRTGVRATIFDDTGTNVLLPWTILGGEQALTPAAAPTADGFTVVTDDRAPDSQPPLEACAVSCDCMGIVDADGERGGIHAYDLSAAGLVTEPVEVGLDADGFYRAREVLAALRVGDTTVVAAGQSIDRDAEIFVREGGAWTRRHRSPAPIPSWIAVLGDGAHQAWLGAEPIATEQATVARLVAGVSTEGEQARGAISEAVDSFVYDAAPVMGEDGATTTFLLRGVFDSEAASPGWKRFEIVEVSARWP